MDLSYLLWNPFSVLGVDQDNQLVFDFQHGVSYYSSIVSTALKFIVFEPRAWDRRTGRSAGRRLTD